MGICVVVCLDNIIVFSKTKKDHLHHLRQVLETLQKHQLKAKPSKCEFLKEELLFLGHVVSAQGIKPDPAKVRAVKDMPPPSDVGQVRTFLGMVAYVCKFIPKCGKLIAPLTKLTQSKRKFLWTPERDHAF